MRKMPDRDIQSGVLILGDDLAHLKAAYDLAHSGIPVVIATEDDFPFFNLDNQGEDAGEIYPALFKLRPIILRVLRHPLVEILPRARINRVFQNGEKVTVEFLQRPQYIDPDLCSGCSQCIMVCPLGKLEVAQALSRPDESSFSRAVSMEKIGLPPCRQACPMGVNVQGYTALIAEGKFDEALDLVRRDLPLPGICGRICHHPCEADCRRAEIDKAVSIRALKRFIADYEVKSGNASLKKWAGEPRNKSVAVIGSGPAGLTSAWCLAREGYKVTIFEKRKEPGGMLASAIAPYRLPKDILKSEIDALLDMGVTLKTGQTFGKDFTLEDLKEEGFEATVISTGTRAERKLNIPGENLPNVYSALRFLDLAFKGELGNIGERVIVVGGDVGLEAARSAVRLGAKEVTLISALSSDYMLSDKDEVEQAVAEGISFKFLLAATKIEGNNGQAKKLCCNEVQLGKPNANGLPQIEIIPDKVHEFDVDTVVIAVGFMPSTDTFNELKFRRGRIVVDEKNMTSIPGVFMAGDVATDASTVIASMAHARATAGHVVEYLSGSRNACFIPPEREKVKYPDVPSDIPKVERAEMSILSVEERSKDFIEVEQGLTEEQAVAEAKRCLQCGICSECLQCRLVCGAMDAIEHLKKAETVTISARSIVTPEHGNRMLKSANSEQVIRVHANPKSRDQFLQLVQGGGASGQAMITAADMRPEPEEHRPRIPMTKPFTQEMAIYLCWCNETMAPLKDLENLLSWAKRTFPQVVDTAVVKSFCHPSWVDEVCGRIKESGANRVLLGSCVCCPLDFICGSCNIQRIRVKENFFNHPDLKDLLFETVNIKERCFAIGNTDEKETLAKARRILSSGIQRLRKTKHTTERVMMLQRGICILGLNEEAITCALNLSEQGFGINIVSSHAIPRETRDKLASRHIHIHDNVKLGEISGQAGDFTIPYKDARGIKLHQVADILIVTEETAGPARALLVQNDFSAFASPQRGLFYLSPVPTKKKVPPEQLGHALASQAATIAGSPLLRSAELTPHVDQKVCRGCGQCEQVCPANAIEMSADENGIMRAQVISINCYNCGSCIGACPNGAMQSPYTETGILDTSIEALLSTI